MVDPKETLRVFKTSGFSKVASKARIGNDELCDAIQEILKGQCDDLGGNVFKKRLNKNLHRGIVLRVGPYWIYVYLFAKKDRENIDGKELTGFRDLADAYAEMTSQVLNKVLGNKDILEICHDGDETEV